MTIVAPVGGAISLLFGRRCFWFHTFIVANLWAYATMPSRHDKTKPGFKREANSSLNEVQLQEVFEEFCFITFSMDILVFDESKAIEVIKECLENQNISDNPRMVLRDLSKNLCLILKDGLDYTFIHKSIQEFYYASFVYNQPEMKVEFYKDCTFSLSEGKHNIISFLESMDTYYFYKNFALPIFDEYINKLNINSEHSTLINLLYYRENDITDIEDSIRIEFFFEGFNKRPFSYFSMLYTDIAMILLSPESHRERINMFSAVSNINLEKSKKIEEIFSQEAYGKIINSLHQLEKKILERREYILRFIDKKNPRKYKKYLNG